MESFQRKIWEIKFVQIFDFVVDARVLILIHNFFMQFTFD